jgi:hypothetical protein
MPADGEANDAQNVKPRDVRGGRALSVKLSDLMRTPASNGGHLLALHQSAICSLQRRNGVSHEIVEVQIGHFLYSDFVPSHLASCSPSLMTRGLAGIELRSMDLTLVQE